MTEDRRGSARRSAPETRRYLLNGTEVEAPALPGALYVVATPIGNLGDVTLRALATLAAADAIACEDTRVTRRLTGHYGIATRLIAYHDHNAAKQRPKLLAMLEAGEAVALVSDAGTPLLSDPGYRLVADAAAAGYDVVPIPGASALLAGLVGAGLPTDAFLFAGFLPPKSGERRKRLGALAGIEATLVFYEAPQRLADTLADMAEALGGDRAATVARELTKLYETFRRGTLGGLAVAFAAEPPPKGEITILVGPPPAASTAEIDFDDALRAKLAELSVSRAVAETVAETGARRSAVYKRALALKAEADE